MSVRPIPITVRPNQGHFLSDLANLFRRHKVRCGDPKDLEHLPSELESNPRLCKDLFLLCTAISHMSEADLSPDELAELIIRAVGGPRTLDSTPSNPVGAASRSAFVERYTAWLDGTLSGTTEQPVTETSDDEETWRVPETPFLRAARLSRSGGGGGGGEDANAIDSASRKVSPETAIGDLTLRQLSAYLIELEQRVKRAEAYLGPVQDTGHLTSIPRRQPEGISAALPDAADEPSQVESGPPELNVISIKDESAATTAYAPDATEEGIPPSEERVQAYVDQVPAHEEDPSTYDDESVTATSEERPAYVEETQLEPVAEVSGHPSVVHLPAADPIPFTPRVAQSVAPASIAFASEPPLAPRFYAGSQDNARIPPRKKISLPTAAVFAFAVLGGAAIGYRFMVQTPADHLAKTAVPETRDRSAEPQIRYDDQGVASGSPNHPEQALSSVPSAANRLNTGAPGNSPAVKPQAAAPLAASPDHLSSTGTAAAAVPSPATGTLPAMATMSAPVLPDVIPAPITRVGPSESAPNQVTRQVIEPYTQRTNSDVTPEAASRPTVETAAVAPRADVPRPSAATPAVPTANRASPTTVSVPSSTLMRTALSIPAPRYPTGRHVNVDTSVVVRAIISRDGRVTSAKAVSGAEDLRSAAQDAMLQWRFRPYLVDGAPVEVVTAVTFMFKAH